jgi:hypothetical protein
MASKSGLQLACSALLLLACGGDSPNDTTSSDASVMATDGKAGQPPKQDKPDARVAPDSGVAPDSSAPVDAGPAEKPKSDAQAPATPPLTSQSPLSDFQLALAVDAKLRECGALEEGPTLFDPSLIDRCALLCELAATCEDVKGVECDGDVPPAVETCVAACPDELPEEFACGGTETVTLDQYCDLKSDCANGEDEKHCAPFACKDGKSKVPAVKLCDQNIDCADGSDELCAVLCGKEPTVTWDPSKPSPKP